LTTKDRGNTSPVLAGRKKVKKTWPQNKRKKRGKRKKKRKKREKKRKK